MHEEMKQMLDINGNAIEGVQVQLSPMAGRPNLCTLWVNVDGICRLRIFALAPEQIKLDVAKGIL